MQIKLIKEFFDRGIVSGFSFTPSPMEVGWILSCKVKGEDVVLEAARGGVRVFSSLDTAVGVVQQITGRQPKRLDVNV